MWFALLSVATDFKATSFQRTPKRNLSKDGRQLSGEHRAVHFGTLGPSSGAVVMFCTCLHSGQSKLFALRFCIKGH